MGDDGDADEYAARLAMNVPTSFPIDALAAQSEYVCWSRMQAEAGQTLETIVARKELERRAGDGAFLWGVGNAPAVITSVLARAGLPVRVVFSVMKSRPKLVDVSPTRIVVWRHYIDADGIERLLPPHALVTSRADSALGPKKTHYALMCHSAEPLTLRSGGERFDPAAFRNAGGTGAPVGNSQVTALLKRIDRGEASTDYEVNLSAWLTDSYWVRLTDPVEMTPAKHSLVQQLGDSEGDEWTMLVSAIRDGPRSEMSSEDEARLI